MVIEAGAFNCVPTAAAFALKRDNGALLPLGFVLPLAKTDRDTQTHRWSRSGHYVERRTAAGVASTSSDLEVRRETEPADSGPDRAWRGRFCFGRTAGVLALARRSVRHPV